MNSRPPRSLLPRLALAALIALAAPTAHAADAAAKAKKPAGSGKTLLKVEVSPPSQLFIDNKPHGTTGKAKTIELTPGRHIVRVVHKKDEHEEQVVLKKGETTEYGWKFEDDAPAKQPKEEKAEEKSEEKPAEEKPAEEAKPEGSAEPTDPAPANPPRSKGKKAPKKDPLDGIDAPK